MGAKWGVRVRKAKGAMYIASLISVADRSSMPPLLIVIAHGLGASLGEVAATVAGYSIAYALAQLLWSRVSDRAGRVRVIVISLAIASLGCLLSAIAWDLMLFGISRAITGAAFAATVPAALTYFGDNLTQRERVSAIANLTSAVSVGIAIGTFGAALVAEIWGWRWVFVATAVSSIIVGAFLARIPDPGPGPTGGLLRSIATVFRSRWAAPILVLTFLEGFAIVGVMGFLPASLQVAGSSTLIAGLVTASYGITVLVFGQLTKLAVRHWPPHIMILGAGIVGVIAYAIIAVVVTPVSVLISASLLGAAWAFSHTTMQTWMTDAVAAARATGVSLFAMSLFVGAGAGAAVGAVFASEESFAALFTLGAVVAAVFTCGAVFGRSRYQYTER